MPPPMLGCMMPDEAPAHGISGQASHDDREQSPSVVAPSPQGRNFGTFGDRDHSEVINHRPSRARARVARMTGFACSTSSS